MQVKWLFKIENIIGHKSKIIGIDVNIFITYNMLW